MTNRYVFVPCLGMAEQRAVNQPTYRRTWFINMHMQMYTMDIWTKNKCEENRLSILKPRKSADDNSWASLPRERASLQRLPQLRRDWTSTEILWGRGGTSLTGGLAPFPHPLDFGRVEAVLWSCTGVRGHILDMTLVENQRHVCMCSAHLAQLLKVHMHEIS